MKLINISGEPREYREDGVIYEFPLTDIPTQVPDEIGKKLILTGQFSEVKGGVNKQEEYKKELIDLPEIGKKTMEDIISVYPTRNSLVEALKIKKNLPFDEDIDKILKEHFGGK